VKALHALLVPTKFGLMMMMIIIIMIMMMMITIITALFTLSERCSTNVIRFSNSLTLL